jgi:hypothetical protein
LEIRFGGNATSTSLLSLATATGDEPSFFSFFAFFSFFSGFAQKHSLQAQESVAQRVLGQPWATLHLSLLSWSRRSQRSVERQRQRQLAQKQPESSLGSSRSSSGEIQGSRGVATAAAKQMRQQPHRAG